MVLACSITHALLLTRKAMTTQRWFVYAQDKDELAQLTLSIVRRVRLFGSKERLIDNSWKTRLTYMSVQGIFTVLTVLVALVTLSSATAHAGAVLLTMGVFPIYVGLSKQPYSYDPPQVPPDFRK